MLRKLIIKNFAIIDELELELHDGFNIMTGETGAGKSIILGALGLLLGQRFDSKNLKNKQSKCIIEGQFELNGFDLDEFFKEQDLDFDNTCIVRREISVDGKSRAFINDTPVTIQVLKMMGDQLVDIHSQHETLALNTSSYQLHVIDSVCNHKELLAKYQQNYSKYQKIAKEIEQIEEEQNLAIKEQDYIKFQFEELNQASLQADEQQNLEQEQSLLTHAEEIQQKLSFIDAIFQSDDHSLIDQLKIIAQHLQTLEKLNPGIANISERVKSLLIEVKDISSEIDSVASNTLVNPTRLQIVQERLDLLFRLQHKHRVDSIAALLTIQEELDKKLQSFDSQEERLKVKRKECDALLTELMQLAKQLSNNRKKAFPIVVKDISTNLKELGIPNATIEIEHSVNEDKLARDGFDEIKILFSANKGQKAENISKVASGGELSRVMLCIKSLLAKKEKLPTIIFDEIDTGVSGEVAIKMGEIMKSLASTIQVISITHLPQIAGLGTHHYYVYKDHSAEETSTKIKELGLNDRIVEIAKMLSGDNPSAGAMENAKELLKLN